MAKPPPKPRCSYPECRGHPEFLSKKCNRCKTGFVHHFCQTDYESIHCDPNGIHLGLVINCHPCLLEVIKEKKKRLGLPVGIVEAPETTIPASRIPMPPLLPQPHTTCNDDESGESVPTNVAPTRTDFVPPPSVNTPREILPAQKGFKDNSGIFCKEILYYGKACGSDIPVGKLGYGKIVGVPNRKNKIDYYSIQYDSAIEDELVSVYATQIPGTKAMKVLLKKGMVRADDEGYRFARKKRKKILHLNQSKIAIQH